ncbi:MAG: hypothetical protein AAGJ83_07000, partial [Planctomycetota bacterium]
QPRIHYAGSWYRQPLVDVVFRGVYAWPSGNLHAETLTATGESLSVAVRGDAGREKTHLEMVWDADLQGLGRSVETTLAQAATVRDGETNQNTPPIRPIGFRRAGEPTYSLRGVTTGKLTAIRQEGTWFLQADANAENLAYMSEKRGSTESTASGLGTRSGRRDDVETLWLEPTARIQGPLRYDPETGGFRWDELKLTTDWMNGAYAGTATFGTAGPELTLAGSTRIDMERLALRLSQVFGVLFRAEGIHESDWQIVWGMAEGADRSPGIGRRSGTPFRAKGSIGWDALEIAGVAMGAATVPLRLDQERAEFERVRLPITSISSPAMAARNPISRTSATATLDIGGQLSYGTSPMILQLEQGSSLEQFQVTPEAAASWLRYLAPLAANATRIEGNLDARLDEATIVIDQPQQSRVRGSLKLNGLAMTAGPTADLLIQSIDQIKSLGSLGGVIASDQAGATSLIRMPPQNVDFALQNGVVSHQRMFFEIDRASVMTSGQVGLDSRLNLVAQVPLDQRWLGSDLQGLAGQTITLPVTGSLSRPQLDSRRIRSLVTELGARAGAEVMQNRLNGLIQKQFGSSLDQINSGLEKVFDF